MSLTDCPQAYSGKDKGWPHLLQFWASYLPSITASSPPPPQLTPYPPGEETCVVGEGIGLKLTTEQASTVIEALIGVVIGAFVLCVFFFGFCMVYRARANRTEAQGQQGSGKDLGHYMDNVEREEYSSRL